MINIVIASTSKVKMSLWFDALETRYPAINFVDNTDEVLSDKKYHKKGVVLILNGSLIDEISQLSLLCQRIDKVIVVGENFTASQKIQLIHQGAWGYSELLVNRRLMIRTVEGVLNNEVWLERQLIPLVIKKIVTKHNTVKSKEPFDNEMYKILSVLTQREAEIVELVYNGEDNLSISKALYITNRTVKAHLSAVYRKLEVQDRFHLVVFLKDLHVELLSNVKGDFKITQVRSKLPI